MTNYTIESLVKNNVASRKEIKDYVVHQKRVKRAALNTTFSLGLAGTLLTSNMLSKNEKNISMEQATPIKTVQNETQVKSAIIASPEKLYDGKQHYSKSGKEQIATVHKDEGNIIEDSMYRPVESSKITKINTVGINKGTFDPYVTYYTDKNTDVYVPDKGKVIKSKDDSVIIEHKKDDLIYYSVINGVKTEIKKNATVKKGDNLGKVIGGVLKFSVAQSVENEEASEFIHPNLLVDMDKSDLLDYKTGKMNDSVFKEKAEVKPPAKTSEKDGIKPTIDNQATKAEKEVVKEMPYGETILKEAEKQNVDPLLVAGLIKQESAFDSKAISKSGAEGLMQLMPDTAKGLGVDNALDPQQNVEGGVKYLKQLIERYDDPELALYAYNGGPGNIDKWKEEGLKPEEFPWQETRDYSPKVIDNFQSFKEEAKKATPDTAFQDKISSITDEYKKPVAFGDLSGKLEGLKIGIDAGHYPAAPGAVSWDKKTTELEVNRQLRDQVVSKLKEAGATVVDSQGDSKSLQPGQRARVFDTSDVDFALSLHNNSAGSMDASGTETLYEGGVQESQLLAQSIQNNVAKAIHTTSNRGIVPRNNLGVFTEGETTTALVETGFMSNPYDMELLRNNKVLDNLSSAIVKGFVDYSEASPTIKEESEKQEIKEPAKEDKKGKEEKKKEKDTKKETVEKEKESKLDDKKEDNKSDSEEKESDKKKEEDKSEEVKPEDKKSPSDKTEEDSSKEEAPSEESPKEEVKESEVTEDSKDQPEEKAPEKVENEQVTETPDKKVEEESTDEQQNKEEEVQQKEEAATESSKEMEHSSLFTTFFK